MSVEPVPHAAYWLAVTALLGRNPRHRSAAIALSGSPLEGWNASLAVEELSRALDGPFWQLPAARIGSNWMWRDSTPRAAAGNVEVSIERHVAQLGGADDWTCQMPTFSGLLGNKASKRRSLDLVQRTAPDAYRFIELKVASDNPLYALFELLGYALTYLHAKRRDLRGAGRYDVLSAVEIELLVLAPEEWYGYRLRGKAGLHRIDLSWLADSIAQAVGRTASPLRVMVRYDSFRWTGNPAHAAAEILQRVC